MWGVHDRQLLLRKALYLSLTGSPNDHDNLDNVQDPNTCLGVHAEAFCARWKRVSFQGNPVNPVNLDD